MKAKLRKHSAVLMLMCVLAAGVSGCALLEFIVGPSNETLWRNDLHVAEMLAEHMAGTDGYYAKDTSVPADERKKLEADLLDVLSTLKGDVQGSGTRRELEAKLSVHAKRFPAYIDKDEAWKPEEKKELKEPIATWLERVSKGH